MNKLHIFAVYIILIIPVYANGAPFNRISQNHKSQETFVPAPPTVKAASYVVLDANSNTIISEKNPHILRDPASLTKMLSLYIISDYLTKGEISLDDQVKISTKAWKTGGSRTFVKEGQYVSVENLIKGVIVQSGNDACIALAEHIAGSADAFVNLMNKQAEILGMQNSYFTDPIGMPHEKQKSTAYDMLLLTQALIQNYPQFYHWYQQKWFTFNGIKQPNR
ncbi:MAG: D-alanyl-D-alanine carboxypeptidase, partial [Legionellales bacterium]|nr:D-alanyl-D-alanine carboxypeptidase [Legionellales bacterium]